MKDKKEIESFCEIDDDFIIFPPCPILQSLKEDLHSIEYVNTFRLIRFKTDDKQENDPVEFNPIRIS